MPDRSQDSLKNFVTFEDAPLTVLDRSTLERWATCPAQARLCEGNVASSQIAATGDEVHQALGKSIWEYIESRGAMGSKDLAEVALGWLRGSRPDLQPDVIRAARASLWNWARFICSIHGKNLLRYDGGEGERSGQLAWDFPELGARVTSELDLLHAGPSVELLHEVDYKSGWRRFGAKDVADSFQFQLHGFLVLQNYPTVNALQVRVWNTRVNSITWSVEFTRDQLPEISTRVRAALGWWFAYRGKPIEHTPAWPLIDKCAICDVAARCPVAAQEAMEIATDPGAYVDRLVALEAATAIMRHTAGKYVDKLGEDIASEAGNCFGTGKPKAQRRPTKGLYQLKTNGDDDDGSSERDGNGD